MSSGSEAAGQHETHYIILLHVCISSDLMRTKAKQAQLAAPHIFLSSLFSFKVQYLSDV